MAQNTVKEIIFKVGTTDAVKSVADLKNNISQLKETLSQQEIGSKEYNSTLKELTKNQNALKDAMHYGVEGIVAQKGSYNELVHTMAELKKQWRATADEAERTALGEQILQINSKLKEMDASTGTFSRNVGDYTNSMTKAFNMVSGPIGNAGKSVVGFGNQLKVLSANPVMLTLTVLVTILNKVVEGIKSNEESTQALKLAFSNFQPVLDLFTNLFQKLGTFVANVVTGFTELLKKMKIIGDQTQAQNDLTQREINLQKRLREVEVQNAKDERDIAELRYKAEQSQMYSAAKRLQFVKEAEDKQKQISERNLEIAKEELAIAELNAQRTANDAKANDALAKARAKVYDAERSYYDTVRGLQKKETALIKEETKAFEDMEKAIDADIEAINKIDDALLNMGEKNEGKGLKNRLDLIQKGTAERLKSNELIAQSEADAQAEAFRIEQQGRQFRLNAIKQELEDRRLSIDYRLDLEDQAADLEFEIWFENQKRIKDLRDQDRQNMIQSLQTMAAQTSAILGTIADLWEQNGDVSEKQQERIKGIRTAGAIIDTISGAVGAFMGITKDTGGWGIAAAATQAAAVLAAGYAQVRKIQSTNVSGKNASTGGGSIGASVSAPAVIQQVQRTRTITSASEEERLNRMAEDQRVILVYSDVEEARKHVEVVQSESEF